VTARHLTRSAYLYVRQSTMRQVIENTESTERQYALRQRAIALGWPSDSVVVIDTDLGQSGASTDREGFQKLVAEVGMGRAGIVLGLEVSRLARNSTDWHRLLEICAVTDTLISTRTASTIRRTSTTMAEEERFEFRRRLRVAVARAGATGSRARRSRQRDVRESRRRREPGSAFGALQL
jgi:DNA invertase Pin-like site-specific DNA recombinase